MTRFSSLFVLLAATLVSPAGASQPTPLVRTILFFSPTCPHCHTVITESLPPLVERYGESLVIVAINIQSLEGQRLFQNAGRLYGIPPEQLGVPLLAVGDRALVGSFDIPDQLPAIADAGLAAGGIPWPEIEGLQAALVAAGVEEAEAAGTEERVAAEEQAPSEGRVAVEEPPLVSEAVPESSAPPAERAAEPPARFEVTAPEAPADLVRAPEIADVETTLAIPDAGARRAIMDLATAESSTATLTPWQKFNQDRFGNSIAVVVLTGMVLSVLAVLALSGRRASLPHWPDWAVGLIVVVGLAIAAYLSYVEVTQAEAICGQVGDCNTVQQSPYARLFGLVPIGVLGFYGYAALGLGWLLRDRGPRHWNSGLAIALWLGALLGTLFSIYLTVLEPFVIGATCMWCVTSAGLMTLLLWAAPPGASEAWSGSRGPTGEQRDLTR
jgi:uncharacterized membrane protein/thiol-disulfide isomerase/thioredoxin